MATIAQALSAIDARVAAACEQASRPRGEVQLLAVSKTFPTSAVAQAYAAGQRAFGENYIAEGVDKIAACQAMGLAEARWHCIGPVQSNKTALVAAHFDWVHSIDRLKIAQRLSAQRPAHLPPLQVCLQVNVDDEASKSGVAPADLVALARQVAQLPGLSLRGLMSIPAPRQGFEAQRVPHRILRELFGRCRTDLAMAVGLDASRFDTLSMGMSDDLEAAIAEGATMVRVGRGIFGERATGEPGHA